MMRAPLDVADIRKAYKTQREVTEDSVEKHLQKETARYGALCIKTEGLASGFFDRTVVWPDTGCNCFTSPMSKTLIDWIELKRPIGGKFQPGQVPWRNRMLKLGHIALTLYTRQAVDAYIKSRVCRHRKARII